MNLYKKYIIVFETFACSVFASLCLELFECLLCALWLCSGGVMLVHDIRKNETRVIDFRETAPSAIHEDMLLTNLDLNVRFVSFSLYISLLEARNGW